MDKENIIQRLEETHQKLIQWLENHSDDQWMKGPEGKWTTGQHILHLDISSKLLNKALGYPKFLIKYKFGTNNRDPRTYETVAKRYDERLAESQEKAKAFNKDLKIPEIKDKKHLMSSLQIQSKKLQYKTRKLKEKHLDTLLLPHPLLGRMTLREIIMWTDHHVKHHLSILENNY